MKQECPDRICSLKINRRVRVDNSYGDHGNDIKKKREFDDDGDNKEKIKPVTPYADIYYFYDLIHFLLDDPLFNTIPGFITQAKP